MSRKNSSVVDAILINLILDHYNVKRLSGKRAILTEQEFDIMVKEAEEVYFREVLIKKNNESGSA
jgi:chorismate-pyruvate lyase